MMKLRRRQDCSRWDSSVIPTCSLCLGATQTLDSLGNVQYCDTLDANIDLVFDKPYDFYVEANAKGKTTGRVGPELVVGLTKRNAFRGGERLDINFHGCA